ncbi:hypothetical protein JCM6882_007613 [Rhodosporidiobolus microsporus]
MEPEPAPSSATFPTASGDVDADMSIDYGAGGDAAMDEDASRAGEMSVEEAEMADDEASGWEKEPDATDAMLEEDQPFTSEAFSAAPLEGSISVDTPFPVDFAQPASSAAPQDPPLAPAPSEIELAPAAEAEPVVSSLPVELPSSVAPVDAPLEEALAGPELSATVPSAEIALGLEEEVAAEAPQAVSEQGAVDEIVAEPVPFAEPAAALVSDSTFEAPADSSALPSSEANAVEYTSGSASAVAAVEPVASMEGDLPETTTVEPVSEPTAVVSEASSRPLVDKDPLLPIEVPAQPAFEGSSRGVPAVFLSFDNTTYSLFHSHRLLDEEDATSDSPAGNDEDSPLLLSRAEQHELYYQPVETLFRVVRELFTELKDQPDELVLEFDEIGIALGEDNVYSRQVTLFDFDRIHLGCQLPGRLHARLSSQPRFASGFNALAQHIANSYGAAAGEEEGDEDADASVTVAGEDDEEEPQFVEEEEGEEGSIGERPADDHDGPDSEYATVGEGEGEGEGAEEGSHGDEEEGKEQGEDEFDLEEALAQLDGDDVVAVVEGVQEDYLLSERETQREEGEAVEEGVQEGEAAVEGDVQEGEVEEGQLAEEKAEGGVPAEGDAAPADDVPPNDAPQESVVETDLAQVAEEEGQPAPDAEEPTSAALGEDALAAELPVSEPTATNEDGAVGDEVVVNGDIAEAADEDAGNAAFESAGATSEALAAAETELVQEPADPIDDVVIDYDEAFDGSNDTSNRADVQTQSSTAPRAAAAPTAAPVTTAAAEDGEVNGASEDKVVVPEAALLSPKRSREFFMDGDEAELGEDATAGEAKRPRLADPVAVSSA